MLTILSLCLVGTYFSVLAARARHKSYLDLCAQQDFEWRTQYYRESEHWRWAKDWDWLFVEVDDSHCFELSHN
jgi:hypothetical protein